MTPKNAGKKKVALVIGSGGIKCVAAIGIMKVLMENQIPVNMVVGCSGGSALGAAIALGASPKKLEETIDKLWITDITKKIHIPTLLKIISPNLYGFDDALGVFDDTVFSENFFKAYGPTTTFADTKIPFYCVTTDFHTGETVVISEGLVGEAVRISSSIPLLFKPVEWNGRLLFDGGLSNPLPVDVAIQEGADIIVAVGFEAPLRPTVASFGGFAGQMFDILINQLLSTQLGYYNLAYHSEIVVIVPEFLEPIRVNDISKFPFIIEQGEKEARKHIDYLNRLLLPPSDQE